MRRLLSLTVIALCAPLLLAAGPASARNYDCTKAGNANKAECKAAAAKPAAKPAAAKPAAAAAKAPAKTAAAKPAATAERNYDCSKAGNANKAACKGAAPATTSMAAS